MYQHTSFDFDIFCYEQKDNILKELDVFLEYFTNNKSIDWKKISIFPLDKSLRLMIVHYLHFLS